MGIQENIIESSNQPLQPVDSSLPPKKSFKKLLLMLGGVVILAVITAGTIFVFMKRPTSSVSNTITQSSNVVLNASSSPSTTVTTPDADNDGLSDADEAKDGTDPKNPDTDGDGFFDGAEVQKGFDPLGPGNAVVATASTACQGGGFVFNPETTASQDSVQFGQVNVEIILDGSGSMLENIGGQTKIDAAKKVINQIIDSLPNKQNLNVGFRAYGFQSPGSAHNCQDTKLLVPIKGVDKQALKDATNAIKAQGYTPIAYSLEQASKDFPAGDKSYNTVILISDGIESCGGKPADVARQVYQQTGLRINTHVIGLGVGDNDAKTLKTIADNAGGTYNTAKDTDALNASLGGVIKKIISGGTLHVVYKDSNGKPFPDQYTLTVNDTATGAATFYSLDSNGEAIAPLDPGNYTFHVDQLSFKGQDTNKKVFSAVIKEGFETRADLSLGRIAIALPKASPESAQPVLFLNDFKLIDVCSTKPDDDVIVLFAKNWPTAINPTTSTKLEAQVYPGLYRLEFRAPRAQKVVQIQAEKENIIDLSNFFGIISLKKHPWSVVFPNTTQMADSSFTFPCCKMTSVEHDRGEYSDVYKKTLSVYALPGSYAIKVNFHDDVTKTFTPQVTVQRGQTVDAITN